MYMRKCTYKYTDITLGFFSPPCHYVSFLLLMQQIATNKDLNQDKLIIIQLCRFVWNGSHCQDQGIGRVAFPSGDSRNDSM